jgi:hypothetical protein
MCNSNQIDLVDGSGMISARGLLISSLRVPGLELLDVTVSRSRYGVENFLDKFGIVSGCLSISDVIKSTADSLTAQLLVRTPPISMMLKYVFVTAATALVNLVLVATYNVQTADASGDFGSAIESRAQEKLITKDDKPVSYNAAQQADIKSIHKTLTEFYRGLNEHNVDRMARVSVMASDSDKEYLRRTFARLKSSGIDMSIEVQDIELVSLSGNNARVEISQLMKARGAQQAIKSQQSTSIVLVKSRGRWKVSDGDTVMQSLDRDR